MPRALKTAPPITSRLRQHATALHRSGLLAASLPSRRMRQPSPGITSIGGCVVVATHGCDYQSGLQSQRLVTALLGVRTVAQETEAALPDILAGCCQAAVPLAAEGSWIVLAISMHLCACCESHALAHPHSRGCRTCATA